MSYDAPHFELRRIVDGDSEEGEPEIYPVLGLPGDANMNRRGFLGAGLAIGGALGAALATTGCANRSPKPSARVEADSIEVQSEPAVDAADTAQAPPRPPSPVSSCGPKVLAHRGQITALAASVDGRWLASGARDGRVKIWRLPDGTLHKHYKAGPKVVHSLAFSADGGQLISGSSDGRVRVHKLSTGGLRSFHWKAGSGAFSVAVSPSNLLAAGVRTKPEIRFWQLPAGEKAGTLKGLKHGAGCLAFSPDGKWLAAGLEDKRIGLWNVEERTIHRVLTGLNERATSVAFSPDGRWLASGDKKGGIRLWLMPGGEKHKSIRGHLLEVTSIAFTPDGQTLVTASADSTVKLWRIPDLAHRVTLDKHKKKGVTGLAMHPDGRQLVSAANDQTIRFWALPEGTLENCLFDARSVEKTTKALQFTQVNAYGETVTYTLPCGSPIPPGAVCTCNCVPGAYKPSKPTPSKSRSRGYGGSYCSCNKVCTCVPVYYCQAHRLLDDDPTVRAMAEQVLLLLGRAQFDYMRWAASEADNALRERIKGMMAKIEAGETPDPTRWPDNAQLASLLDHDDDVTTLMAAQLLSQRAAVDDAPPPTPVLRRARQHLIDSAPRHAAVRDAVQTFAKTGSS